MGAVVPFMKGYARVVSLTDDERERLPELLFSRQLIGLVFRVCLDPKTALSAPCPRSSRPCAATARPRHTIS